MMLKKGLRKSPLTEKTFVSPFLYNLVCLTTNYLQHKRRTNQLRNIQSKIRGRTSSSLHDRIYQHPSFGIQRYTIPPLSVPGCTRKFQELQISLILLPCDFFIGTYVKTSCNQGQCGSWRGGEGGALGWIMVCGGVIR